VGAASGKIYLEKKKKKNLRIFTTEVFPEALSKNKKNLFQIALRFQFV
jgi:hypothetical protein